MTTPFIQVWCAHKHFYNAFLPLCLLPVITCKTHILLTVLYRWCSTRWYSHNKNTEASHCACCCLLCPSTVWGCFLRDFLHFQFPLPQFKVCRLLFSVMNALNAVCYHFRVIRLTTPVLSYVISSGAILMYLSVFVGILPTTDKTVVEMQCIVRQ